MGQKTKVTELSAEELEQAYKTGIEAYTLIYELTRIVQGYRLLHYSGNCDGCGLCGAADYIGPKAVNWLRNKSVIDEPKN